MKDLVEQCMDSYPIEDIDTFGEWAFGEKYREFENGLHFMNAWNERHSEKLLLKHDGRMEKDIYNMVQIWKENANN